MSDRRSATRFEIVGRLGGTLAAEPTVSVLNISPGGVLIETPWTLAVNSIHDICLDVGHGLARLQARVCHVRQAYTGEHFLIGLEFISALALVAEDLDRLLGDEPDVHVNG